MNNLTALLLALLIVGLFAADFLFFEGDLYIFLGRKFLLLVDYVAFWR